MMMFKAWAAVVLVFEVFDEKPSHVGVSPVEIFIFESWLSSVKMRDTACWNLEIDADMGQSGHCVLICELGPFGVLNHAYNAAVQ